MGDVIRLPASHRIGPSADFAPPLRPRRRSVLSQRFADAVLAYAFTGVILILLALAVSLGFVVYVAYRVATS